MFNSGILALSGMALGLLVEATSMWAVLYPARMLTGTHVPAGWLVIIEAAGSMSGALHHWITVIKMSKKAQDPQHISIAYGIIDGL
jgi:hypothetical protein